MSIILRQLYDSLVERYETNNEQIITINNIYIDKSIAFNTIHILKSMNNDGKNTYDIINDNIGLSGVKLFKITNIIIKFLYDIELEEDISIIEIGELMLYCDYLCLETDISNKIYKYFTSKLKVEVLKYYTTEIKNFIDIDKYYDDITEVYRMVKYISMDDDYDVFPHDTIKYLLFYGEEFAIEHYVNNCNNGKDVLNLLYGPELNIINNSNTPDEYIVSIYDYDISDYKPKKINDVIYNKLITILESGNMDRKLYYNYMDHLSQDNNGLIANVGYDIKENNNIIDEIVSYKFKILFK